MRENQPQYSPDRKFYWDGLQWVPVPQPTRWAARGVPCATNTGCLIIIGIFLVFAIAYLLGIGR